MKAHSRSSIFAKPRATAGNRRFQFAQPGEDFQILLVGFAEANSRIEDELLALHTPPATSAMADRTLEKFLHAFDDAAGDVSKFCIIVHQDNAALELSGDPGKFRVTLKAVDVIDDFRAGRDGGPRHRRFVGVDGNRHRQTARQPKVRSPELRARFPPQR